MKQASLKKIRVILSILFLISITAIFLDFRDIFSTEVINSVLFFQFVPSILKFINVFSVSALGFLIILSLTFLYGRVYCSTVCPLGILQDLIAFISKKIPRKKKFRYKFKKPHNILRYSLLVLAIITFLSGTVLIVNFLDPYSNFGRITTNLFKPLFLSLNNFIAGGLEKINIYALYPVQVNWPKLEGFLFPLIILGTVILMSLKNGRLYCNTICPVGALLGVLSKYSMYKIKFDKNRCTSCAKCAVECKSLCINVKQKTVDETRCVDCYNCISVCPDNAIYYQRKSKKKPLVDENSPKMDETDISKRTFIAGTLAYFLGSFGFSRTAKAKEGVVVKNPTAVPVEKNNYVSPPGSLGIAHMKDNCTACHLCVSTCPTDVLQPSFLEYGFTGIMQPYMDYHTNYCNFECTKCGDVCPTGAILPVSKEEKKTLQLGQVNFIKENCVVYTEDTACGSCSEHCPTQAVYMVPYKDNLTIPEINPDICVGCGACEYACPTRPYRAIYVDGHAVHAVAEKPKTEKMDDVSPEEDFPF